MVKNVVRYHTTALEGGEKYYCPSESALKTHHFTGTSLLIGHTVLGYLYLSCSTCPGVVRRRFDTVTQVSYSRGVFTRFRERTGVFNTLVNVSLKEYDTCHYVEAEHMTYPIIGLVSR